MNVLIALKSATKAEKDRIIKAFQTKDKAYTAVISKTPPESQLHVRDALFYITDPPFTEDEPVSHCKILQQHSKKCLASFIIAPTLNEDTGHDDIHIFKSINKFIEWLDTQNTYTLTYHDSEEEVEDDVNFDLEDNIELPTTIPDETENTAPKEESDSFQENASDSHDVVEGELEDVSDETRKPSKEEIYRKRMDEILSTIETPAMDKNKRIGFWSPVGRVGVTTFIESFALTLAQDNIQVAVLEGITERPKHLTNLKRYSNIPSQWTSYASSLFNTDTSLINVKWTYEDIHWFPCAKKDCDYEWDSLSLKYYIKSLNRHDVTLIDFPSGKMSSITEKSLEYVDELWIMVDYALDDILPWMKFIEKTLKQKKNITLHYIYLSKGHPAPYKQWLKEEKVTVLAEFKEQSLAAIQNRFSKKPLYLSEAAIRDTWEAELIKLKQHIGIKQHSQRPMTPKPSKLIRLIRSFV